MNSMTLVFPHQLFADSPAIAPGKIVYMLEEPLFFADELVEIKMHKGKIALHRASMQHYADALRAQGHEVKTLEWAKFSASKEMFEQIPKGEWHIVTVDDFILNKRIKAAAAASGSTVVWHESPLFLNTQQENKAFFETKKRWHMADFYKFQRTRLQVLMNEDGAPEGGKWSYDEMNRKKVPKRELGSIPALPACETDAYVHEAITYANGKFASHVGVAAVLYPHTHAGAAAWLHTFFTERFQFFGAYEDAIAQGENSLWHSVITPMLNIGLLTPHQVLRGALAYGAEHEVPLNSLEGFVRQIIGWREFIRASYHEFGISMRNENAWNHTKELPKGIWDGTTGIEPIDDCIKRIVKTGYCHHIERLMVLGGFFFLCEVHPKEIYRWFIEMFADSYDWVMVPNVYAMSQNSAGGLITTKPYFSGSAYIRKMSHYPKGEWCDLWDGLYWRWIEKNSVRLQKNHRWAMMVAMAKKNTEKNKPKVDLANQFLQPKTN